MENKTDGSSFWFYRKVVSFWVAFHQECGGHERLEEVQDIVV